MSTHSATLNTEAAILARLIQGRDDMNREVAQYLLAIDFSASDVERMNVLSQGAREGTLSAEEMRELDSYLHVGNLLTIMQSKARVYLRSESGGRSQ
jgi:hypothetical protein